MWDDCYNYNEHCEAILQSRLYEPARPYVVHVTTASAPSYINVQWTIASNSRPKYNEVTIHEED